MLQGVNSKETMFLDNRQVPLVWEDIPLPNHALGVDPHRLKEITLVKC